ncbi:ABC transporter permease [Actinacidiphila rubida]|uniref:Putative ABC transport system permease protein n=1 Tax=Actinacidiphila rubida TaxID=310780 RepID=A0A1H8PDN7_9ACTN|nr:FtsX family ABC transporter permease [Actinacidiphila rubida]SEO39653.1 putative ABC transport system permease protein [Actinacidiphila rubida]
MSALGKIVRAGVGRRRLQSLVMVMTTMTAVTASVMAAGLVVASRAPFDHTFGKQHGAHLTAAFDSRRATGSQVAATAHAHGVSAAAGPFPLLSLAVRPQPPAGLAPPPVDPVLSIAGRADAAGGVDDLTIVSGHWITGPGQIVITDGWGPSELLGTPIHLPGVPGDPALTVVGTARSATHTADAWVTPRQIAALTPPGSAPTYQMLYRFTEAGSTAAMTADRAAVNAAAPAGSLRGTQSYLVTRDTANRQTATFVPFVMALGILGLVMSVLIIGIVVSGAVSAGTRRIGILKSLGFTPAQVGRAYVGQALIPASVGTALGLVLGNLGSIPLLSQAEGAYNSGALAVAGWIDVAVPAAVLALVVASALAPALRAGRLHTVEALAIGRTPQVGRGRWAARLAARLPLPRPLSLGLAGPFARPARSATIAAAIVFGAVGVTFAYGLGASINGVQHGLDRDSPGQVQVDPMAPPEATAGGARPTPRKEADPAAVARAIAAQPGTRAYFSSVFTDVHFLGVSDAITAIAYQGDSSWASFQMVSGRWFTRPGEAVVGHRFLQATATRVGDVVTLEGDGRSTPVRIVGEAMTTGDGGMRVLTDAGTLARAGVTVRSGQFSIELKPGTDRARYVAALSAALRPLGVGAQATTGRVSATIVAMDAITAILTLMLVLVAGLGVLNTVVLDTRERVHDLGVMKALGMAPRQTVGMVITSVAGIGALAGLIGVPLGIALHDYVVPKMGDAAGTRIPSVDMSVYHAAQLVPLALGGLLIAVLGALLPASWAARTRTATALRTE